MLQQDVPEDFVIATGETHTIRAFLDLVFEQLDLDWEDYVEIDPRYFRPAEVDLLLGDASKAQQKLGWTPATDVRELARLMVEHDLELAQRELHNSSFAGS
jgi:GDPmannose 4,6-dehydratase